MDTNENAEEDESQQDVDEIEERHESVDNEEGDKDPSESGSKGKDIVSDYENEEVDV